MPSHTEDDVNFVVVRENSEGLYTGAGGFHRKGTPYEVAVQESINTRHGVERIVRYAFDLAMRPDRRRKLTLVHKTNVLTFAGDLYQRVVDEVGAEFPDVETDYVHVDAACIYFLDWPARFDVIVTDNMFGDIITDLGAMIQGGMGIAAGGNINPEGVSMFEPIGGTAPDHTGKGTINPLAAIGAVEMLLRAAGRGRGRRPGRPRDPRRHQADEVDARRRDGHVAPPRSATSWWRARRHERSAAAGRAVRHHPARRRAAGRPVVHDRGPAPHPAQARPGRLPLRRGRLARREPARYRVLQARHQGDPEDQHAHGVRHDAQGGGASGGLAGAARPARCRHRVRLPGGQGLGPARHRGAAHRPGRGRRHGARLRRVPAGAGPARVLRRRALLRRLPLRSRRSRWRCWPPPRRSGAERLVLCDTNGGMLPFDIAQIVKQVDRTGGCEAGYPRAQRRRLRRGQHPDRGGRRCLPGAGHDQRLRRTNRQRRPDPDHRRPDAEDGRIGRAARGRGGATSPSWRTTSPTSPTSPPTRVSPTRAGTRSRTRPACTPAGWPGCRAPTNTSSPRPWATGAAWWPRTTAAPPRSG